MENLLPPFEPEKARAEALARAKLADPKRRYPVHHHHQEDRDGLHIPHVAERIRAAPRLPGKGDTILLRRRRGDPSQRREVREEDHERTRHRLLEPTQGLYGGSKGVSPLMAAFTSMKSEAQAQSPETQALVLRGDERTTSASQQQPQQRQQVAHGHVHEGRPPVQILNASRTVRSTVFRRGVRMRMESIDPEQRAEPHEVTGDVITCILMPREPGSGAWAATVGPNVRAPHETRAPVSLGVSNRHAHASLDVARVDEHGSLVHHISLGPGETTELETMCDHPWLLTLGAAQNRDRKSEAPSREILVVAHRSAAASRHHVHLSWNSATKAVTLTSEARFLGAKLAVELM